MSAEPSVVFVVDDDVSIREALRNLLRSVGWKVEAFGTAQEFLSSKRADAPACLVLDVRLPGLSGLDLQRQLVEANVQIPIIFITAHGDIQMSVRAMKAGAVEFLTKPFRDQDLLDAVQQAVDRDRAARVQRGEAAKFQDRYATLSQREQEVLGLVVRGLLNKQIAGELRISEATVKLHRGKLMQKMGAGSLADLIRMAEEVGVSAAPSMHGQRPRRAGT
jgi:FixJ family two-component response regulator